MCPRLFVIRPSPATLLKKRLWCRCFPGSFAKFLRTTFLQNTSGRLLLDISGMEWVNVCFCIENASDNKFCKLFFVVYRICFEAILWQFLEFNQVWRVYVNLIKFVSFYLLIVIHCEGTSRSPSPILS